MLECKVWRGGVYGGAVGLRELISCLSCCNFDSYSYSLTLYVFNSSLNSLRIEEMMLIVDFLDQAVEAMVETLVEAMVDDDNEVSSMMEI